MYFSAMADLSSHLAMVDSSSNLNPTLVRYHKYRWDPVGQIRTRVNGLEDGVRNVRIVHCFLGASKKTASEEAGSLNRAGMAKRGLPQYLLAGQEKVQLVVF